MSQPLVSVIIPAYNQSAFIGQAIHSVLDQTFPDWELIVVDDGSSDRTAEVVAQFDDPRLHYVFQENRGLPGARNRGIECARGAHLAFLDADDAFHPRKLEWHVAHLESDLEIGLSYASRIEMDHLGNPIWLLRAPAEVSLSDLVLGFPFSINDLLLRREWVERAGYFDESFRLHGEDRDFYLRLALEGCRFDRLDRFVAYRRLHARRQFSRIQERIDTMHRALDTVFDDPRCPMQVAELRNKAYAKIYLPWISQEFSQDEAELAREHLRQAVALDPEVVGDGTGKRSLSNFFVWSAIRDGGEHEENLRKMFRGLPEEFAKIARYESWGIARGYLIRGMQEGIWGRLEQGKAHFSQAVKLDAELDDYYLQQLIDQLNSLELALGRASAEEAFRNLSPLLNQVGKRAQLRFLHGYLAINQAFKDFQLGEYGRVPHNVLRAVVNDPQHLTDRGVLSIFARSLLGLGAGRS